MSQQVATPEDQRGWNELGYKWARFLQINWYHAMADLDELRQMHGDRWTVEYVNLRFQNG